MLSKIIAKFISVFTPVNEQQALDKFIIENNPTSVNDVEYLTRLYDQRSYTMTKNSHPIYYKI